MMPQEPRTLAWHPRPPPAQRALRPLNASSVFSTKPCDFVLPMDAGSPPSEDRDSGHPAFIQSPGSTPLWKISSSRVVDSETRWLPRSGSRAVNLRRKLG